MTSPLVAVQTQCDRIRCVSGQEAVLDAKKPSASRPFKTRCDEPPHSQNDYCPNDCSDEPSAFTSFVPPDCPPDIDFDQETRIGSALPGRQKHVCRATGLI